MTPARTTARKLTRKLGANKERPKITTVEKSAEPAARPSRPSMRLKALVMSKTQKIVNGKPIKV